MTVTDDRIGLIPSAVILHDCSLLFQRMSGKFSPGLFYIMSGCEGRIFGGLFTVQGTSAEIRVLMISVVSHISDIHFPEKTSDGILFFAAFPGSPAVLNGNLQSPVVGEWKQRIAVNHFP